jgi:hypothetical protein
VGTRALLLAGFLAATALIDGRAQAMGAIATSPPGASSITEVHIAVSSTGTRTSRWVSLHVHGSATAFAWIVPVKPDAFVDLASDAWLESLEDATAPRVVPPDVSPPCGEGGVEVEGDTVHTVTTRPDSVAIAADQPTLVAALSTWNLAMSSDLVPLVEAAGANGDSFVALLYTNPLAEVVTRTVRVVDTSAASVPLALTAGPSGVTVTAYAFGTGALALGSSPALTLDGSQLLWRSDGTSTYAGVLEALLTASPGRWALETAGNGVLFSGEVVPGGAEPIPAVAPTYFSRAWTYGDTSAAPSQCSGAVTEISTSLFPVALACPAGALAQVGEPSCEESPVDGQISPDTLRCGGISDDLAIALSGLAPANAWLTRAQTVLAQGTFGADSPVSPSSDASTDAISPLMTCSGYGDTCEGNQGSPPQPQPSGGSPGVGGSSGGGASTDPGGSNVGSAIGTVVGTAIDSTSDEGCGGDSSSESGDSCDGDTSVDDGGGDDCSGGPTSDDCSLGAAPHRRAPTSRLLLLGVAVAAIARRRPRTTR